ncbi:MAG: efflux RND transporter permease subunit [Thermodesulfobacteriota bacterium]
MYRYISLITRNPLKVIFLFALLTVIFGSGLFKVEFESSLDSIMPKKDEQYILNEKIKDIYGNNGKFIIASVSSENLKSPDFLDSFNNLHIDLEEYKRYKKTKEEKRIEILKKTSADYKKVEKKELLEKFSDDRAFQRYLKRTFEILELKPEVLDKNDIQKILEKAQTSREIKKKELIDLIISPYTIKDVKGEDNALISYNLIEKDIHGKRIIPQSEKDIEKFFTRLKRNPAFEKGIYSSNKETGRITDFGIMIRLKDSPVYDPIVKEISDIAEEYKDLDIIIQGIPVIYQKINQYMKADLSRFLPLVFMVVLLVFYLNFRSFQGMVIPFTVLAMADIWIIGLMGHLGYKLTIVGISLPPLMIAVGSSYSIHILNQYYNDSETTENFDHKEKVKSAVSHISSTVILAGVTTFLGFFMLVLNQVSSVREMGVFSAIGVLFAVFISTSLIPAMLSIFPSAKKNQTEKKIKNGFIDSLIRLLSKLVLHHSKKTIAVLMIIAVFSVAGLMQIVVETSVHAYFKKDDYIIKSSKQIGEKYGGAFGLNIIIESEKNKGIKDPEILKFIEKFRAWLTSEKNRDLNIGRTESITDFIKTMHLAMNNNNPEFYKIPNKKIDIESYISVYPGRDDNDDGLKDDFEPYVDWNFKNTNIFARIWEKQGKLITSGMMNHIDKKISRYLESNLPAGYSFKTSGEPKIIVKLSEYIVKGQIMSLSFSLAAVFLVVFLLFRNFYAALLSLLPISSAVLFNFGIMGWSGIRLDLATSIISSITIGIGIDDSIHFLKTYKYWLSKGMNAKDSVRETLQTAGKAIIYTSLALTFGFLVLVISTFKPIIYFGLLIAGTMISATVGALVFLPAVIIAFKLNLLPVKSNIPLLKKNKKIMKIFKFTGQQD